MEPYASSVGTSLKTNLYVENTHGKNFLFYTFRTALMCCHFSRSHDTYNCGIAVPCALAIILCDVIIQDTKVDHPEIKYAKYFSIGELPLKVCESTEESYCDMPLIWFKPLPTKATLVWDHYMAVVREQWFLMFNRLAELQHKRQPFEDKNPNYQGSKAYFEYADPMLLWPYGMDHPKRKVGIEASYLKAKTEGTPANVASVPVTQSQRT